MYVAFEKKWTESSFCQGCHSYLRYGEEDLFLNHTGLFYVICPVCDTKNEILKVPDYLQQRLRKLLESKSAIDNS